MTTHTGRLTRTCPFAGCRLKIPEKTFACRKHWFTLTRAEQARIWHAFAEYRTNGLTLEELRAIQQDVLGERGKIEPPK